MNLFAYVSISVVLIATVILYIIFHKNNLRGYRYVLGLLISAAVAVATSLFFPQVVSFFTVNWALQFVVSLLISIILYVTILFLVMILVSALFPAQMADKKKQKPKENKMKDQGDKKADKKADSLDKNQGSSDQKSDHLAKVKEIWKQTIEKWTQIQQKQRQNGLKGKTTKDQPFAREKDVKDTERVPESTIPIETVPLGELAETADPTILVAEEAANDAVAETADPLIVVAEQAANDEVSELAAPMLPVAEELAETADPTILVAEEAANDTVAEASDQMTAITEQTANKTANEIQVEAEHEIGNADDCKTLKEDKLIENAVISLSNLPENDENTEKNVDTSDIIDKMGIGMVSDTPMIYPQSNGSALDQTIEKAFSLKQEGRPIEAATLFMEALDKEPDLETIFWVVLDLCAIYKNAGQIELAEDILLSYVEQYEDLMSEEIKDQILHSLYM